MSSRLRTLTIALCPGIVLFVILCYVSNLPTWTRTDSLQLPLGAHVPAATRDTRGAAAVQRQQTERPAVVHDAKKPPRIYNRYSNNCEDDGLCMNYLTPIDTKRFRLCVERVKAYNVSKVENGTCRFVARRGRGNIALASFPGSGNTWVRSLLESATGVCTGAFVCDISLRARGFAGENIQSGSALVVKTHRYTPFWSGEPKPPGFHSKGVEASYTAAIVLIRNPFDALMAEWNRVVSNGFQEATVTLDSHAQKAGKEWFGDNTDWNDFVYKKVKVWQAIIKNWVVEGMRKHPILVVKYEDLKRDTFTEVKRMLNFLSFGYDAAELKARLDGDFATFHRTHKDGAFDHFTPPQRAYIRTVIEETATVVEQHKLSSMLTLSDYLHS